MVVISIQLKQKSVALISNSWENKNCEELKYGDDNLNSKKMIRDNKKAQ
jgi:hypothetical protein